MKNEGVTILQIVIIIIIMIVLATIAVFYGQGIPREAKLAGIYTEIREIEGALEEGRMLNKIKVSGDTLSFYGEISVPKVNKSAYQSIIGEEKTGDFYYLDFTSSRKLENAINAENIKNDYLLDFQNLNIYLIKGIDIITSGDGVTEVKYNSDEIENYYKNTFIKKN